MPRTYTRTALRLLTGCLGAGLFVVTVSGQSILGPPSEANHFVETPKGWVQPKTPWGDPDIQGMWPISYVGSVPLERCGNARRGGPPCDVNKAWLTEDEYKAALGRAGLPDRSTQALASGNYGAALLSGVTDPTFPQRQTSLIVDPPNGKLPELTPDGKRLASMMKSSWALPGEKQTWDAPEDFDSWDRCITRGMPSSMMPYRYNNGLRIMQTPGYVVLDLEMIHESRIVPLDNRPSLPSNILQYMGESRGHWEGNTLVVVTTNYKPGPSATNIGVMGSPPGNRVPVSPQMKTTERFTRLNDNFLLFEMKTEDPVVWTRPWTVRYPLMLQPKYDWWEYACHEGNSIIPNYVSASRAERAKEAAEKNKQQSAPTPASPQSRQQ
jgi:hypothetical protein